jgi:hypothetical protein
VYVPLENSLETCAATSLRAISKIVKDTNVFDGILYEIFVDGLKGFG